MFAFPQEPTLANFGIAWDGIKIHFFNSLFYVGIAVPLIVFLSCMAAYALSRFDFKGKIFNHSSDAWNDDSFTYNAAS